MTRLAKVNDLLRDEISAIIRKEFMWPAGTLVTVTRVETAADLKNAKVFISVFPKDQQAAVISEFKKRTFLFQKTLNKKLVMRYIPRVHFNLDDREEKTAHLEELLNKLGK